jgi:hypothetical protein
MITKMANEGSAHPSPTIFAIGQHESLNDQSLNDQVCQDDRLKLDEHPHNLHLFHWL